MIIYIYTPIVYMMGMMGIDLDDIMGIHCQPYGTYFDRQPTTCDGFLEQDWLKLLKHPKWYWDVNEYTIEYTVTNHYDSFKHVIIQPETPTQISDVREAGETMVDHEMKSVPN